MGRVHAIRLHAFGPPEHLVLDELARPRARPRARCGSRSRPRAGCTCSTPRSAGRAGTRCRHPSCRPSRAARWPASSTTVGPDVDAALARAAGGRRTSGRCRVGTPSRRSPASSTLFEVRRPRRPSRTRSPRSAPAAPRSACVELEPAGPDDVVLVPVGGRRPRLAARAVGARGRAPRWWRRPRGLSAPRRSPTSAPTSSSTTASPAGPSGSRDGLDGVTLVYDGVGGDVGRAALELLRPGGRLVMFGFSAGYADPRSTTADLVERGISAGWSLGPRMIALPGGIPGPGRPGPGEGRGRGVAAARVDVPAGGRGPGARRPRGPPGAGQGRAGVRRRDEFGRGCRSTPADSGDRRGAVR